MSEVVKHTPGPWEVRPSYARPDKTFDVVGPSEIVCGLDGICEPHRMNDRTFAEDKANMVLIAAAPELFDALHKIGYAPPEGPAGPTLSECVQIARAAIAKAEGRS